MTVLPAKLKIIVLGQQYHYPSAKLIMNKSLVLDTWLSNLTSTLVRQEVEGLGYAKLPEQEINKKIIIILGMWY